MSRHHPACPEHAHQHPVRGWLLFDGHVVWLEREPVLCASEIMAERLVKLLNTHGLADVPECVPDSMTWGAPRGFDRVTDWRLPEDPRQRGLET